MNTRPQFATAFPSGSAVLIVVHVENREQTLRSIEAAVTGGADGCFLIQHREDQVLLRKMYRAARRDFPNFWTGLNFLGKGPASAARLAMSQPRRERREMLGVGEVPTPDGLWVDDPLAVEQFTWEVKSCRGPRPEEFLDIHAPEISVHAGYDGNLLPAALYFAGAGFKYQGNKGVSLEEECRIVMRRSDVVTTSGDRTGQPPTVQKIERIRGAIGPETPLAIASGVSAENVRQFLPFTQAFLVASSVTGPGEIADADKVRALVGAARG